MQTLEIAGDQQNDRTMWYRLVDKVPVPSSMEEICLLGDFQKDKAVRQELVNDGWISTVFLGLNHNCGDGPPILFETMVFGGEFDGYQDRYSTWEEAEEGHKKAVDLVTIKLLNGNQENNT